MSSKNVTIDYGEVRWRVVPGSRREQLLLRFIRQDEFLNGATPQPVDDLDQVSESLWWGIAGLLIGAGIVSVFWWLTWS